MIFYFGVKQHLIICPDTALVAIAFSETMLNPLKHSNSDLFLFMTGSRASGGRYVADNLQLYHEKKAQPIIKHSRRGNWASCYATPRLDVVRHIFNVDEFGLYIWRYRNCSRGYNCRNFHHRCYLL